MKLIPTPPAPDFTQYTCSASIDFVKVFHPTHVSLPIESKQRNIHCDLGQGQCTTIHDPSPEDLDAVLPLLDDARIIELEVSLDFRVRGKPDDAERERMLHELKSRIISHLYPWEAPGIQEGHRVSHREGKAEQIVSLSGDITPARIGSTLYLGHSNSRYANPDQPNFASIRFYLKQRDNRHALAPKRWSVRVEVTLTREGCENFGLRTLDDLRDFNYRKLNEYFRMVLPSYSFGTLKRRRRSPKHGRSFDPTLQAAMEEWVAKYLARRVRDAGTWSLLNTVFATPERVPYPYANRRIGMELNNLTRRFARGRMRSAGASTAAS